MKNRDYFGSRPWFLPAILVGIVILAGFFGVESGFFGAQSDAGRANLALPVESGVKTWMRGFERHGDQSVFSILQTPDGGYVAAGVLGREGTESPTGRQFADAYLLKLDSDGNSVWEKTIGSKNGSMARDVQQTLDGGFVAVGSVWDFFGSGTFWDVYLVKTDENGDKLWEKAFDLFGGKENDWAYSVQQTSDGGYLIGGWTLSNVGNRLDDAFLLKTDGFGNKLWENYYGGGDIEDTRSSQQTSDGGYMIAGWTSSFDRKKQEDQNVYLVKTDASGNQTWAAVIDAFGKHETDSAFSARQTSDRGYIFAGTTQSVDGLGGNLYAYLLKVDERGNKVWENTFGEYGGLLSVQQTSDGGYVAAGRGGLYGVSVYLLKTDAAGNNVWEREFKWVGPSGDGNASGASGYSVYQTSDGGYVVAAELQYSSNPWQNDILLIKTDRNGNVAGYGLKAENTVGFKPG